MSPTITYLQDLCSFAEDRRRHIWAKHQPSAIQDQIDSEDNVITEVHLTTYLNMINTSLSSYQRIPQPTGSTTFKSASFPTDNQQLSTVHSISSKYLEYPETGHRKPTPHISSRNPLNPDIPTIYKLFPPCRLHEPSSSTNKNSSCPHPIHYPPIYSPSNTLSPLQSISALLSANKTVQSWISSIPLPEALPNSFNLGWQAPSRWGDLFKRQELYSLVCLGYDLWSTTREKDIDLMEGNKCLLKNFRSMLVEISHVGSILQEETNNNNNNNSRYNSPRPGQSRSSPRSSNLPLALLRSHMQQLEAHRQETESTLRGLQSFTDVQPYVLLLRHGFLSISQGRRHLPLLPTRHGGGNCWAVCPTAAGNIAEILKEVASGLERLREDYVKPVGEVVAVDLALFTRETEELLRLDKAESAEMMIERAVEWLGRRYERLGQRYREYKEWDGVFRSIRSGYKCEGIRE